MREIFFNSFKERILRGDIPAEFELSGAPVTSKFFDAYDNSDITIEQFRTLSDFDTYHTGNSAVPPLKETLFEYSSYGVEYSTYEADDISEKPLFVNSANSAEFYRLYDFDLTPSTKEFTLETISDSGGANYNYGFYYAMKKSHLNWLAKRCNDEWDFNNQIRIVLGDDIGNLNDQDSLESMFCPTPDRPFQGVFDMNGHKIINKTLHCKNNSNGLFGYLGRNGKICNGIVEDIRMICQKPITLDKIRDDCSDVVCGFLVGTNYGTVENIVTSGVMQFDGFCPDVYLVNNKYEYEDGDVTFSNSAYNCFFPNKFCINSVYNVLPYVGYFCEGADSFFNDVGNPNTFTGSDINTIVKNASLCSLGYMMDNESSAFNPSFVNLNQFFEGKCSITDGYDQTWVRPTDDIASLSYSDRIQLSEDAVQVGGIDALDWVFGNVLVNTVGNLSPGGLPQYLSFAPMISTEANVTLLDRMSRNSVEALKSWESYDGKETYKIKSIGDYGRGYIYVTRSAYLCAQLRDTISMLNLLSVTGSERVTPHQRLNPNARIAYYCSPIVGNNFGTIHGIDCKHTIRESNDTFVGFIGNVCGKQNCGSITTVTSTLDMVPNSGCKLNHKTYTKQKSYAPNYPDDWGNLYSVFGYNWDYYQSPYGVDPKEYSANSADCVRVTESYYDFNDFIYSGVNPGAFDRYIFNRFANKDADYGNCNFAVTDSATSATIGSTIPDQIRSAKLKMKPIFATDPDKFEICFKISSGGYYGRVKFYDPYNEGKKSNSEAALNLDDITLSVLASYFSFDVQHFDLNYLGDAAKTLNWDDNIKGICQKNKDASGEKYPLTAREVLINSSAFNGELGNTVDGAQKFCRNIMNAKIAMGSELLANSAVCASAYFSWQDTPFRGNDLSPFGTLNYYNEQWDTRWSENKNRINPNFGPNNTDQPWDIFEGDNDNGPDMCWYMPPASNDYTVGEESEDEDDRGENGPKAFSTASVGDKSAHKINENKNNMNWFCSIHPKGKWDLLANKEDWSNIYDENAKPSIDRSVVTIIPRQGTTSSTFKEVMIYLALTDFMKDYGVTSDQPFTKIAEYFGNDWDLRLEEIKIPLMNRTQNSNYQSSTFEGVANVSGVYIHAERGTPGWAVEGTELKFQHDEMLEDIGNLESMYVSMSLVSNKNGRKRLYPITLELPISDLYIPISCISAGEIHDESCSQCTLDFANIQTVNPPMATRVRDVSYYPLVPAYNVEDTNGELVDYPLKSIYNVGAIAGMINHSEKHIDNGNHLKSYYGPNGEIVSNGGLNIADCGMIGAINVCYTDRAMEFIDSLMTCSAGIATSGDLTAENDRTIGVANKFSLIAPVYEYHQNEMGTSIEATNFYTDSLQRIPDVQKTQFTNIMMAGTELHPLIQSVSKSFNPFIHFSNISNVLDYTNFFEKRVFTNIDDRTFYIPFQDSNYPEMLEILWDTSCLSEDSDWNLVLFGGAGTGMSPDSYPAFGLAPNYPPPNHAQPSQLIHLEDLVKRNRGIRTTRSKRYEYLPSYLIGLMNVAMYDTGTTYTVQTELRTHLSAAADFICSDYNDIFMQLLSGSPNLIFSRLTNPMLVSQITAGKTDDFETSLRVAGGIQDFYAFLFNHTMIDFYNQRLTEHAADMYFTWDYELGQMDNYPLTFNVRYENVSGTRGLWIHQNIQAVDEDDSNVGYPMKGESGCLNDGSNIALGYMPSDEALVQIMNTRERGDYDEGVAVSGKDFRGIVLFDASGNLVVAFDSQNGRDIDCEAVVYELPKKAKLKDDDEERNYGLLTRIEAE